MSPQVSLSFESNSSHSLGLTYGATRASIAMSFVRRNNLGDITAKAHAQGLAAYLAGMGLGVGLTLAIGEASVAGLFGAFAALAGAQLFFSYRALRAVRLATLNPERLDNVLRSYLTTRSLPVAAPSGGSMEDYTLRIPFPTEVIEHIILPLRSSVTIGATVDQALGEKLQLLPRLLATFATSKYMIWANGSTRAGHPKIFIMVEQEATPEDLLEAALHGYYLQSVIHARKVDPSADCLFSLFVETQQAVERQLPHFLAALSAAGWTTSVLLIPLPAQYSIPRLVADHPNEERPGFRDQDGKNCVQ